MAEINTEQCRGCKYWRHLNGCEGKRVCHYILDTKHMRKRKGSRCLSKDTSRRKRTREWELPDQLCSAMDGYAKIRIRTGGYDE